MRWWLALLIAVATSPYAAGHPTADDDQSVVTVQDALYGLTLVDAVGTLRMQLAERPHDDVIRFGLGIAEFLHSGEVGLGRMYVYGARPDYGPLAMLARAPQALRNPDPQVLDHDTMRQIVRTWLDNVRAAEKTLAGIDARDLKLPVHVGRIRFDIDGNESADGDEALWMLFGQVQRRFRPTREAGERFAIAFDRGDVHWLRGYCHVVMATCELILAYDTSELFARAGHVLFPRIETTHDYLMSNASRMEWQYVDLAAFLHLINLPLIDADRCRRARTHLLEAIAQARQMWRAYDAETDDDREWVPNPNQTAAIPNATLDQDMRETWLLFLDEAEAVLEGKRLLRFWRTADGMDRRTGVGVNLKRVLTEPRRFDLVLWIQGTAAEPYLEDGTFTEPQLWRRMESVFGRRPFRYAFWMN